MKWGQVVHSKHSGRNQPYKIPQKKGRIKGMTVEYKPPYRKEILSEQEEFLLYLCALRVFDR